MTEIEKEIMLLFRQLTPREKQQFSELCRALSAYNAQQTESSRAERKEAAV